MSPRGANAKNKQKKACPLRQQRTNNLLDYDELMARCHVEAHYQGDTIPEVMSRQDEVCFLCRAQIET